MIFVTAVTSGGVGVQILGLQEGSGNRVMTQSGQSGGATPVANQTVYVAQPTSGTSPFSVCAAGNAVNAVVATSHAGSSAVTGTVYAIGYYIS